MARSVSYRIADRPDERFDVIVVLHPRTVFRQTGLLTVAEAEEWVDGLWALMAACGAQIVGGRRDAGVMEYERANSSS